MVHGHLAKKVDGGSESSAAPKKTSDKGQNLIREFEGLRLESYLCPSNIWTIGYGSTGPDVVEGLHITQAVANQMLVDDLKRFEKGILDQIDVELDQNQFDALVSWAFNVGLGATADSTLRRRINWGEYINTVISEELPKWVNGPNGPLPGLVRRRDAEVQLATEGSFT